MVKVAESVARFETVRDSADRCRVCLLGPWLIDHSVPTAEDLMAAVDAVGPTQSVRLDGTELEAWDSALIAVVVKFRRLLASRSVEADLDGLPPGAVRLVALAEAVPERPARKPAAPPSILFRLGSLALAVRREGMGMVAFVGEAVLSMGRMVTGRARYRRSDLWLTIHESGVAALPIVSIISVLVGLILAFVGAVQLKQFGTQIFIANLVGIAMAREMGAMMAAIIMCGRTGAAFAAQIGTMQVNEEVDALRTLGLDPFDFLVLPRMIALILMMPFLCIYAILIGILGGALVAYGMFDISFTQFIGQTQSAVGLSDFAVGVAKSVVFGVLIALTGCLRGMQCGRSAAAVGESTTSAVVTGIVLIVVTNGLFAILTNSLGI